MRPSILYIIIALLLAVLFIGERALPCIEICADDCASEGHTTLYATDLHAEADHQGDHDDSAPSDQTHHCGHCSCPCHIPALSTPGERFVSGVYSRIEYTTLISVLPSISVRPPDHIPLA